MESERGHIAVLQQETLQALQPRPSGYYLDGTYGRGGHCELILNSIGSEGRVFALDQDPDAVADAKQRFGSDARFTIYKSNFEQIEGIAVEAGVAGSLDGVLLDLGVSSAQLDTAERGFSFSKDGYLDMRMDPESGLSASQWLQQVTVEDLAMVLKEYGEERYAKRIAAAVIAARDIEPLTSTLKLAEVIKEAHPRWERHRHPATKSFQAIRIFVNRELEVLHEALEQCSRILKPGGRLVVISFHSLEDRIVKRFLRGTNPYKNLPRHLPMPDVAPNVMKPLGKKLASAPEVEQNHRARSAVLRVGEKTA